jgi:hypothetical protein
MVLQLCKILWTIVVVSIYTYTTSHIGDPDVMDNKDSSHIGDPDEAWTQLTSLVTSAAAHARPTMTGCLFITDSCSKRQFLIDTNSDLWLYTCRLILRGRERVNYDLCC